MTLRVEDRSRGHLVFTRKPGERFRLRWNGEDVWVEVLELNGRQVRLGVAAPRSVVIEREEIIPRPGTSPGGDCKGRE